MVYNSSLVASNKNLLNKRFSYIDVFNREGPTEVSAMRGLTSELFEQLDIASTMDVY